MKSVTVTYEIVTPESAEHGDAAERGFYQPGGWHYPTPDGLVGEDFTRWCEETGNADPIKHDDIYEVARDAIYDGYGVEEGCDSTGWSGRATNWTPRPRTATRAPSSATCTRATTSPTPSGR